MNRESLKKVFDIVVMWAALTATSLVALWAGGHDLHRVDQPAHLVLGERGAGDLRLHVCPYRCDLDGCGRVEQPKVPDGTHQSLMEIEGRAKVDGRWYNLLTKETTT